MTQAILRQIAQDLDPGSPYFGDARKRGVKVPEDLRLGDRYRIVLSDPSFGWNVAESYFRAQRYPPIHLQRFLPYRAYTYLRFRGSGDRAMAMADALWQSGPVQRTVVQALLLDADAKLLEIAQWSNVTPEAMVLFTRLRWNVRERLHDFPFMANLLMLHDPFFLSDTQDIEPGISADRRLWRVGYRYGVAGVRQALRVPNANHLEASEQPAPSQQLNQLAGEDALAGVLQGFYQKDDNPAAQLYQKLIAKSESKPSPSGNDEPIVDALTDLSVSPHVDITDRLLEHMRPGVEQRIQNMQGGSGDKSQTPNPPDART